MKNSIQPWLFWLFVIFLAAGLVYPVIGLIAIICMLATVVVAPFKGRHWCGNFCPRGSFYDQVVSRISPGKKIPALFSHPFFRLVMLVLLTTVFLFQMYFAWGNPRAMGMVFVRIVLITTLAGTLLGAIYHHRTWCSFCPMGTLASWISRIRKPMPLFVEDSCVECGLCEKACPFQLKPYEAKGSEAGFTHSDCIKCGRCVPVCPKGSLSFTPKAEK